VCSLSQDGKSASRQDCDENKKVSSGPAFLEFTNETTDDSTHFRGLFLKPIALIGAAKTEADGKVYLSLEFAQ